MKYLKNQKYETYYESSTIPKGTMARLGTIEADASSHYGRHDLQAFRGEYFLNKIVENLEFNTVLDVGSGKGHQKDFLRDRGKQVHTCDFEIDNGTNCNNSVQKYDYSGDFTVLEIKDKYDLVFSCHVLEHQRNSGIFLEKKRECSSKYICTIVPIRKPFIVGGHCSIWNPGLLLYNLVLSGIDCSECYLEQKDYEICVLTKNKTFDVSREGLTFDEGDIKKLMKYFPFELTEPFNGDIMKINTLWRE